MAHKLAEETIADILTYSLDVPDEDFISLVELAKSPFVNRQTSSSTALLVCKRWMRIGTPLLYNAAIMRSTAQADALALALKANPSFRPYVKKLRIEGGFGVSVRKILEMAPNVTDLWILITYAGSDRAKPMCAALEKAANIRRLAIYRPLGEDIAKNANTRLVVSTLSHCVQSWTSLRVVHVGACTISLLPELGTALLAAHHLEEFYFPEPLPDLAAFLCGCPSNIKRVRVGWEDPGDGLLMPKQPYFIPENERFPAHQLAKIIFAPSEKIASVAAPSNPFYEPMKDTPSAVRRKIWSRVFELLVEDCSRTSPYEWTTARYRPVKACLAVSSEFRDVMLEIACRQPDLKGFRATESFAHLLKKRPSLSLLVEDMDFKVFGDYLWFGPVNADQCFDLMKSLIPTFVNMRSFRMNPSQYPLELEQFSCLSAVSETLRELKVHLRDTSHDLHEYYGRPKQPPFEYDMPAFASLKTLSLTLNQRSTRYIRPPPLHAFDALESLYLDGEGCDEFLDLISPLRLSALCMLEFARQWGTEVALAKFCRAHGKKLTRVTVYEKIISTALEHCPNLECLAYLNPGILYQNPPLPDYFRTGISGSPHHKLKEISCPRIDLRIIGRGDKLRVEEAMEGWTAFFDFLVATKQFPALEIVRVGNRSELWPITERDIAKSPLPGWAEKLLSKGIKLVDANGLGWTPRLKAHRRTRPL